MVARDLDELVRDFRERPLDAGSYTFVAASAMTMKVRKVVGSSRLRSWSPPASTR